MISPTFKLNGLAAVSKALDDVEKQVRFATARALTQVAKQVQGDVVQEMARKFDRPTPYTLRSTFVKPATRSTLVATVGIKDIPGEKAAASSEEILYQQFRGGGRIQKRLEKWLVRAGLISAFEFMAPGAGARLDQYGNMSRGQVAQIMSQLRLGADMSSWSSNSKRSQRAVKKAGRIFWSRGSGRSGHLRRGAWIVAGGQLRPLLMVVKAPTYQARVDLDRTANATISRTWKPIFERSLADAFRTAR